MTEYEQPSITLPETSLSRVAQSLTHLAIQAASGSEPIEIDSMRHTMTELLPLFSLKDEEFHDASEAFIDQRIQELSIKSTSDLIEYGKDTSNYIGNDTDINAATDGLFELKPFRLDDLEVHSGLIGRFRDKYLELLDKGRDAEDAYFTAAVLAAESQQRQYFGNILGRDNSKRILDFLAMDIDYDGEPFASIVELKSIPMCMQRSAVEHNLLKLLGIDSQLTTGTLVQEREGKEPKSEHHAFLIVKNEKGEPRIIDPTNPILKKKINPDGKTVLIGAATRSIQIQGTETEVVSDGVAEVVRQTDGSIEEKRVLLRYRLGQE